MSNVEGDQIDRRRVGEMPILQETARRLGLRDVLARYIPGHGNELAPAVDTAMLLIYSIARSRKPLYELEEWASKPDPRMFDFDLGSGFDDDRFGRALDKIYWMDRASAMTEIVLTAVRAMRLDLTRSHNDSTTLSAAGRIPDRTRDGLFMARGHSKGHRPDLKQLVYCLTLRGQSTVGLHNSLI